MDALLMCGGEGTRLGADREKPLVEVSGKPMVERVWAALAESRIDRTFAVVSPAAPNTATHVSCPTIETPGDGYVADLNRALADDRLVEPVLTVAADLPLLDGPAVDRVLDAASGSLTVAVPAGRKRALGLSVDTATRHRGWRMVPAGINVVGRDEGQLWVTRDPRFAVNVNRPGDVRTAAWRLAAE